MSKFKYPILFLSIYLGFAAAQRPIIDMLAKKVVEKYQSATCDELAQNRTKPKTARQEEAVKLLRADPEARTEFIDKVAGPIANKMFDCGMIP